MSEQSYDPRETATDSPAPTSKGQHAASATGRRIAALASIAILLVACGGHSDSPAEQLAKSAHDRMVSLCDRDNQWPDLVPGPAPPKAIAFTDDGHKQGESDLTPAAWHYVGIPSAIEATDEGSVHTVICDRSAGHVIPGLRCSNGNSVSSPVDEVKVFSWPDRKYRTSKTFEGSGPAGPSCRGGSAPNRDEINAWLQSVIH